MSVYDALDALPAHPAACPYCGSTRVNQACLDGQIRPARLNDDGSLTCGEMSDAFDFKGPEMLYCWGCCSTFVQPADVVEDFDFELQYKDPTPDENPSKDDPAYIGADVRWLAMNVRSEDDVDPASRALNAMYVCTKDPQIRLWLEQNDPMALRQLQEAIEKLDDAMDLCGIGYISEGTGGRL